MADLKQKYPDPDYLHLDDDPERCPHGCIISYDDCLDCKFELMMQKEP